MKKWWSEGIRFECQGSGKCCLSHGEYGHVYLTKQDRIRMSNFLGLTVRDFTKKYCERDGDFYQLIEESGRPECVFLKDKRCSVYEARPTQCRTWPFWPDVMNAKTWSKEVASFCPGVGKGPVVPVETIAQILKEQRESEEDL